MVMTGIAAPITAPKIMANGEFRLRTIVFPYAAGFSFLTALFGRPKQHV
jgi:hypothetical protein